MNVRWDTLPRMLQELCDGHPGYMLELYRLDVPARGEAQAYSVWLCQSCWVRRWSELGRPPQLQTRDQL